MLNTLTYFDDVEQPMNLKLLSDPLLLVNNTFRIALLFKGKNQAKASEQGTTVPFFLYCAVKARILFNDQKKTETGISDEVRTRDARYKSNSPYERQCREEIKNLLKKIHNLIDDSEKDKTDFAIARTIHRKMLEFVLYNDPLDIDSTDDIDVGNVKSKPYAFRDVTSFTLPPYLLVEMNELTNGESKAFAYESAYDIKEVMSGESFSLLKQYSTNSRQVQNLITYRLIEKEVPELLKITMRMVPLKKADKANAIKNAKLAADRKKKLVQVG
jgi:membrane-associated HD superfamily phosphohydrolase